MDTTTANPLTLEAVPADRCSMCQHVDADHDPLARRYCDATASGALTRGCICR